MIVQDGDFRLFDYDFHTGRSVWVKHNPDGSMTFRTDTPVQHILDANAEDLSNSTGQKWGDGRRTASVPLDVYREHLKAAAQNGDRAYIKRWLNDSDNAKFRTFGGRL